MSERPGDRWISISLSVLVHGAVVGLLLWGWWNWKHTESQPQQLAIDATVVDANTLPADVLVRPDAKPDAKPEPAPPPPPSEPEPQPAPAPAEPPPPDAQEQQKQRDEEQRREQEQRALEEKTQHEKQVEEKQRLAERAIQEKAAAAKAADEKRQRDEAEQRAREKADKEAKQRAAEQRLREQRESELRSQLAAEEHLNTARSSGMQNQYLALIQARIERAWIRPPSARAGLVCEVQVTQIPGGEVVGVKVGSCNGDEAVRQSLEAAVYRASPLPPPSDPALFDRSLVVTFRPRE
jgi:colicin import membrane protein